MHNPRFGSASVVASGLPQHYYSDPAILQQEWQHIWGNTWQLVGRVEDLSKTGDYLACLLGQEPIVVVRTLQGLRAMHNICQHRGAQMLTGQGNCKLLRCPYHAWTYDLDGHLLGVPQHHLFPTLDKSTLHLGDARVDTWGGFVFVNPNPDSESLEAYLAAFPTFLEQYEYSYEELREIARWSYEEPINWKLFVENYVEDYHFSFVHARSLELYDFGNIQTRLTGRHCQIYVPYTQKTPQHRRSLWQPEGGSYQGYIFPNLMVNTAKDHVSVFRVFPLSSTQTRIEVIIYQSSSQSQKEPTDLKKLRATFDEVMEEDFAMTKLLQAGVQSRAYRVSHLAEEHELGIAHFHQVLSEYIA